MSPPGPTIAANRTRLPDNASATSSPHTLEARPLYRLAALGPDPEKRIKSSQRRYTDKHDRKIRNALLAFTARHYINTDQSPMTTYAAEGLAMDSPM